MEDQSPDPNAPMMEARLATRALTYGGIAMLVLDLIIAVLTIGGILGDLAIFAPTPVFSATWLFGFAMLFVLLDHLLRRFGRISRPFESYQSVIVRPPPVAYDEGDIAVDPNVLKQIEGKR